MLQSPCKTLGFKKNMVYKIPPGGGGKPYPASGLKKEKPNLHLKWANAQDFDPHRICANVSKNALMTCGSGRFH